MNNEQLHDWLANLHDRLGKQRQQQQQINGFGSDGASSSSASANFFENPAQWRPILQEISHPTNMLLNYFASNFEDTRLSAPLVAQLISLYYKFDVARCFVLQLIPAFIHAYLKALTKRRLDSTRMMETLFLAIYNEEILAAGPGTPSMAKRSEDVRLPFMRQSSVAMGESFGGMPTGNGGVKIQLGPQTDNASVSFRAGSQQPKLIPTATASSISGSIGAPHRGPKATSTVRVGPYPAIDVMIAENRFTVLTRLMRTVSHLIPHMAPEVIHRSLCRSLLYICRSGFSFQESDFRQRVLREWASSEVFADFSKKSRIRVSSRFLVESINGVNSALLNGYDDIALRALDAIHQRAMYEMMADVLLVTNALRNALSDPNTLQAIAAKHSNEDGNVYRSRSGTAAGKRERAAKVPTIEFSPSPPTGKNAQNST